jgi:hypothetical protein
MEEGLGVVKEGEGWIEVGVILKPDNLAKILTHLTKIPQGYPGKLDKLTNKHLMSSKTHQIMRELLRDIHK